MSTHHLETTALITGAAQGLGLAIAKELIGQGCTRLVLSDINPAGEAVVEGLCKDGVDASFIQTDMGDTQAAIAMVDEAAARMGQITALVNAAGNTERGTILDTTPEHWDRINNANAKGPFFALQRFAQLAVQKKHAASAVQKRHSFSPPRTQRTRLRNTKFASTGSMSVGWTLLVRTSVRRSHMGGQTAGSIAPNRICRSEGW